MKKPVVFVDADVIFAGVAAPTEHGASHMVLRLGEITLLDCVTSQQAAVEVERNIEDKLPGKLLEVHLILRRSLRIVADPAPPDLEAFAGQADRKDLPILVAALQNGCTHLLTFNLRHYHPAPAAIIVQRPGDFLVAVRSLLYQLSSTTGRAAETDEL